MLAMLLGKKLPPGIKINTLFSISSQFLHGNLFSHTNTVHIRYTLESEIDLFPVISRQLALIEINK